MATNYEHGIASFGNVIVSGGGPIVGKGDVYWVDPVDGLDSYRGKTPGTAKKTLSGVHSVMTANQNDIAYVLGNSSASASTTCRETATLVWSKSLTHVVGTGYNRVAHRVSLRMTGDFTPQVTLSGSGCTWSNMHWFDSGTSSTQAQLNLTGERNAFYNIHFGGLGGDTARDAAGAAIIKIVGTAGEHYFKDCVVGLDTADRGAANASILPSAGTTRNIFENTIFTMRADAGTPIFLNCGSGGIDRWMIFKDCTFINTGTFTGGSTLTEAFTVHASAGGGVILAGKTMGAGIGDWENTQSSNVYVESGVSAAATGVMAAATT